MVFCAQEMNVQSGKGTQNLPGQKEPVLSGEAVRDTASGAQGWERPLQMHTFYLPPHQVVTHLQREPFQ